MQIVRGVLIGLAVIFLLATMAFPFGAQFAFRGFYLEDGAAKIAEAERQVDELRQSLGGKLPPEAEKQMDEQLSLVGVAKSMANWELALIPLALVLVVTLFLKNRLVPIGAAIVLAVAAVLAVVTIPEIRTGIGLTSRFEMMMVAVPAIVGSVLGLLASLVPPRSLRRSTT